jgi:hypothetical protein
MTFVPSQVKIGRYLVMNGDAVMGFVTKEEKWTVRGTRIQWRATLGGNYYGTESTRKAAAELLVRNKAIV